MSVRLGGKRPGGWHDRGSGSSSWDSMTFFLTLLVSIGAVGSRVEPRLRQFSDGQLPVQGRLAARHGQALACTHLTPRQCVQHWVVVRGADPAVTAGLLVSWFPLQTDLLTAFGHRPIRVLNSYCNLQQKDNYILLRIVAARSCIRSYILKLW